jgi:hypothetical protein
MPSFPSLMALNDWLEARCRELWAQCREPFWRENVI